MQIKTMFAVTSVVFFLGSATAFADEAGTGKDRDIPDAIPGQGEASSAGFIESLLMWFDVGNHSED